MSKASFLRRIKNAGRYLLIILPALVFTLSACRSDRQNVQVIEFWAMGVEAQQLGQLATEFEQENPGLHVRIQAIPWSAAHEKLLTAYAGNSTPDLCQLGNTWIPEFVILNALEPLNSYLENSEVIDAADYFSGIWATNEIGESLYGIPWYVDTRLLFYRRDVFAEFGYATAPKTWSELFDLALKIQKAKKTEYAFYLPLNGWHEVVAMAMQSGSTLLRNNDSYGDFSTPEFQNALRFFLKLYEYRLCPLGMNTISNLYQSFADNYFSIYISGPWNLGEFQKRLPESMQAKWAVAPMPSFHGEYPGVSTAGGSSIVMFKNSTQKAAAWKLIEFLSRPEIQARFYELSGDLPANCSAWDRAKLHENEKTEAFFQQLQRVQPTPRIPEWEQIALKIQQHVEIMAYGKMNPEEVGTRLNSEVDRLLEKRRWLLEKEQK
ncbi:MAG: sugar ABC transporter substrate-binding protein [Candidatus Neomarinimicrobiota bacterium]